MLSIEKGTPGVAIGSYVQALQIIKEISTVVNNWKKVASKYKISNAEQEWMSDAFN